MLKKTNTANGYSPNESQTDISTMPRSSGTFVSLYSPVPLTSTEDLSTWLQQDSRANHSASTENDLVQTMNETCGLQHLNASAEYDPSMRIWKTYQGWLLQDISAPSWEDWSKQGMMQNGVYYPQPSWKPRIAEIDFGLLPTPMSRDWKGKVGANRNSKSLPDYVQKFSDNNNMVGSRLNPEWVEWLMGWPPNWTSLEPLSYMNILTWQIEPDIPRTINVRQHRKERIMALGNGQVPVVVATAWILLTACNIR